MSPSLFQRQMRAASCSFGPKDYAGAGRTPSIVPKTGRGTNSFLCSETLCIRHSLLILRRLETIPSVDHSFLRSLPGEVEGVGQKHSAENSDLDTEIYFAPSASETNTEIRDGTHTSRAIYFHPSSVNY